MKTNTNPQGTKTAKLQAAGDGTSEAVRCLRRSTRGHSPYPSRLIPYTFCLTALFLAGAQVHAEDAISLPPLEHYQKLWSESLFTTRALPPPEAPAGPNFATNLALTGTFEVNSKMAAVIIDKATSNITQVFIGEDNAEGIRIAKVELGATPDKMRLQLQKGREFGWVGFGDDGSGGAIAAADGSVPNMAASGPGMIQPGAVPGLAPSGPLDSRPQGSIPALPQSVPVGLQNVPRALPSIPEPPPDMSQQPPASLRAGAPEAPPAIPNDVPLPPP